MASGDPYFPLTSTFLVSAPALAKDLRRAVDEIEQKLEPAINDLAEYAAEEARSLAPVETGRLRDSISVDKIPNGYSVSTGDEAPYGFFWEVGFRHSGVITDASGNRKFFPHLRGRFFRKEFMRPSMLLALSKIQDFVRARL